MEIITLNIHHWLFLNWYAKKEKDFNQLLIVLFPFLEIAIGLRFMWATDGKPWTRNSVQRPFFSKTNSFFSIVIKKFEFGCGFLDFAAN